jgi:peroxiredoxin
VNFADYDENLILLSFVNTGYLKTENPSIFRSQLVFLKSMKRQYEDKGLKVVLIDVSQQITPGNISKEHILNFISDEAEDIPVLLDSNNSGLAEKFGVETVPATFLISREGMIIESWENLALPAQLAFCIENELRK